MMNVHDLAEHVELKLTVRRIADPYRSRVLVTGQPGSGPFGQPPLARDTVHDLQLTRTAGDGAQQPFAPRLSLLEVAGMHGAEQNQCRIAQPAISVIPVALAAEPLGNDVVGAATMPPVGA